MAEYSKNMRKWSMLSKKEKRSLVINTLSIPKYLRFHLARQTEDRYKIEFHHLCEHVIKQDLPPSTMMIIRLKGLIKKSAGWWPNRVRLFFLHVFTRS